MHKIVFGPRYLDDLNHSHHYCPTKFRNFSEDYDSLNIIGGQNGMKSDLIFLRQYKVRLNNVRILGVILYVLWDRDEDLKWMNDRGQAMMGVDVLYSLMVMWRCTG